MQDPREQNKKVKTKAAMLEELESLKGLLREEDEIPILQEVIEARPATGRAMGPATGPTMERPDKPLSPQALHQLQDDFTALSQTMTGKAQIVKKQEPAPTTSASLLEAFTRASQHEAEEHKASSAPQAMQTDLPLDFDEEESPALSGPDTQRADKLQTDRLVNERLVNDRLQSARQPLTRAQGENPFLPQHIRARLHGNRPMPSFELAKPEPVTLKPEETPPPNSRQALVDALVDATLPRLERELREKLASMSQETLKRLLNES